MTQAAKEHSAKDQASRQFLTFTLASPAAEAGEPAPHANYGIDLLAVQEIRGYVAPTPIPNAARHVKGAFNLRGAIIPVLDLRLRFGLPDPQYTKFTVIIVVAVAGKTVGLVADSVSDVIELPGNAVLPPPDFGPRHDSDCIEGLAESEAGGGLVLILSLARMLVSDGLIEAHDEDSGSTEEAA